MDISNLDKQELEALQKQILSALEILRRKEAESLSKKGITSLKVGDKILGINLSLGGHRLDEPEQMIGEVDFIDFFDIEGIDFDGRGDSFRLSISHPTEPIGVSTTLSKNEYEEKHCYLNIDRMKTGYDTFYTLKPETWRQDLFSEITKAQRIFLDDCLEESKMYTQKLTLFLESEEKITSFIQNLN